MSSSTPPTPPPPGPPAPPGEEANPPPRRPLLIGAAVGVLLPLLVFGLTAWLTASPVLSAIGSGVWAAVAFAGVVLLGFRRSRRFGVGLLLGFSGLLLVGAGTCTVTLAGLTG